MKDDDDIELFYIAPSPKECIEKLSKAVRDLTDRVEKLENRKAKKAKPVDMWKIDQFEICFWEYYPKKIGKAAAVKAWDKLKPNVDLMDIMNRHFREAYKNTEKCFIPNPATYLNQARWNDEIIVTAPKELKLPYDIMDVQEIAVDNGIRIANPGEEPGVYRKFVKSELEGKV